MSRRKLRSSGSPISFFAFQDIITAVSGILIIVTLLLALNVGQSHSSAEEEKASAEQESKLARLLDELTVLRRTAERDVTEQVGRATASELKSRAAELNEQAELLATKNAKQKAGAKGMSDDVTVANRAQLLAELGATMNPRKAEILALEGEAERKAAEAKTAAQAVGKAQAALVAEQARKNVLRLIPEPSASNREPVVVQLGARSCLSNGSIFATNKLAVASQTSAPRWHRLRPSSSTSYFTANRLRQMISMPSSKPGGRQDSASAMISSPKTRKSNCTHQKPNETPPRTSPRRQSGPPFGYDVQHVRGNHPHRATRRTDAPKEARW